MNEVLDRIPFTSTQSFMTTRFTLTAFLGLFLISMVGPLSSAAQSPTTDQATMTKDSPWTEHFGEQLRVLLEAPGAERQTNAMHLILRYARQPGTGINFRPAVRPLFEIYESDAQEGRRLLALSALEAIGSESVLKRLASRVQEESSERVRRHTVRVLTVHLQDRNKALR